MMNKHYNQLVKYQKDYPALTFQNDGYEYLSKNVQEEYKKQIKEISGILRETVKGFTKFNNFKLRADGSISVRYQCYYDGDSGFIGVAYSNIESFKDVIITDFLKNLINT